MDPVPNFGLPFPEPLPALISRNNPAGQPQNTVAPPEYSLYAIVIQQGLLSALGTLHSGKFCEQPKTLHSTRQSTSACMSHSVILASRALLGKSNRLLFPTRFNELL